MPFRRFFKKKKSRAGPSDQQPPIAKPDVHCPIELAGDLSCWIDRPTSYESIPEDEFVPYSLPKLGASTESSRVDIQLASTKKDQTDTFALLSQRAHLFRSVQQNAWSISCWEYRPPPANLDDSALHDAEPVTAGLGAADLDIDSALLPLHQRRPFRRSHLSRTLPHADVPTEPGNGEDHTLDADLECPPPGLTCSLCHKGFTARKSLLRHMRTVHRERKFNCSQCNMAFARKDTRDRHGVEKHSSLVTKVKCLACGRYVSKRAFAEHQDSEICRAAYMCSAQTFSIRYVGAEDDPFLAALRMLRLFEPDTNNSTVPYIRLKLQPRSLQDAATVLKYESCVARLLIDQMKSPTAPPRALGLAALLLGFMAIAGQGFWGGKAPMHFEGAAKIFRTRHDATCACDHHKSCPRWSPFAPSHSENALLNKSLKHIGVDHKLLEAYTPEDEAAFAKRL